MDNSGQVRRHAPPWPFAAAALVLLAGCGGTGRPPQALEQAVLAGRWAEVGRAAPQWAKSGGDRLQAGVLGGYAALARGDLLAAARQFALVSPGARAGAGFAWAGNLAAQHPGNAIAHLISADALARQDDRVSALTHLNVALSIDPNLALARLARATLLAAREPAGAFADAERLAAVPALAAEALAVRGTLHLDAGELEPALDQLSRAVEAAPSHAVAYNARGVVHAKDGDWEAAATDFETAFRLLPELKVARENWQFVRSAAARASVVSSKVTIFVTDYGINNWNRNQKMFADFTHAAESVVPDLKRQGQILIPMPERMPATDAGRQALTRKIAQGILDRVHSAKTDTFEVRLVQDINTAGYASRTRQRAVNDFGKIAYDALALVKNTLKHEGSRVDMPAIVGSNGAKVLTETLPLLRRNPIDRATLVDGRAWADATKNTYRTLNGKLTIVNTAGDIPAGFNMIGNHFVAQNLKKELPDLKVYFADLTAKKLDLAGARHLAVLRPQTPVQVKELGSDGYKVPIPMKAWEVLAGSPGGKGAAGALRNRPSLPESRGGISLASANLARSASGAVGFAPSSAAGRELAAVYTLFAAGRRR